MPALNASTYQQIYGDTQPIAVIGAGCRFPRADDIFEYWQRLADGEELIDFFDAQRLSSVGIDPAILNRLDFVPAGAVLDRSDRFEWEFFGYSRQEAESIDPQQRFFLMCAWEALEMAGYRPGNINGKVGVIGAAKMSTYMRPVADDLHNIASPLVFQKLIGNDKDYLATRTAYKLGLTGPALTVQTACSSSLVATHLACEQLASGEADMVLAGGVGIAFPQESGYVHRAGMIFSPDGRCRPFDAAAEGTTIGNGAAVLLLKRLERALEDGDPVLAVIRGSAINNDGGLKAGFTAPSVEGQRRVISEALELAAVDPSTIGFVEAHGTATPLGDPIEVAALTQAWSPYAPSRQGCALGSVKSNLGHLDTAAGVASLLKAAMAVWHAQIPPSLHFETPNPAIDFEASPFFVPQTLLPWPGNHPARRAAVSSFGIGGTNSHIVIEDAPYQPAQTPADSGKPLYLLLSARDDDGLRTLARRHIVRLSDPESAFDTAAYAATSFHHRTLFPHRLLLAADDAGGWIDLLYAFIDDDKTRISAVSADEGIVAWHAGLRDAAAAALVAASGNITPDWTAWVAPPTIRALLPVAPFGGERCWREQTDNSVAATAKTSRTPQESQETGITADAAAASWQAIVAEGHRRAGELADSLDLSGLAEEDACIDALHTCYVSRALEQLGVFEKADEWLNVDEFLGKTGIPLRYRDLGERLLRDLATAGALQRRNENGGIRYGILRKTAIDHEDWLSRMRDSGYRNLAGLIERTGPQLAGMLTGAVDPVSAVFPAASTDDVEHMYREQPYSVYFNRIAASAAATLARHSATPLRILEIGAGTGGTTHDVLQSLPSSSCENYTFTDVGPLFLQRAKQKFAACPFMRFASFDIEKPASAQPLPCERYDLIIAANVLHNASDLRRMLANLGSLLSPDGVLMMREITVPKKLFDFVFGPLVPPIDDTARRNGELFASLSAWDAALRDAGFVASDAFPDKNLPTAALGEHIIVARWPGVAEETAGTRPHVVARNASPALSVAANRHGDDCTQWTPGRLLGAVLATLSRPHNLVLEYLRWHADPCGAPDPLPLFVERGDNFLDVSAMLPDGTRQRLFDARLTRSRVCGNVTPRTSGAPYGYLVPDGDGTPFDHAISAVKLCDHTWPSRIRRLIWPTPSENCDLRHYEVYRDNEQITLAMQEKVVVSLEGVETVAALPQPWRNNGALYRWQWQPFAEPVTVQAIGKLLLVGAEPASSIWASALRDNDYQVDILPTLENLPAALLTTYAEAVAAVCYLPPTLTGIEDTTGILAAQQRQIMTLATLLQTLAQAAGNRPTPLPVAVLTSDVCAVGPSDTLDNYLSAGLNGLLNVARHEFLTLAPVLIDHGDATPQEVAVDLAALLSGEAPQLAMRRDITDAAVRWQQPLLMRQAVVAPAALPAGRHVIIGALSPLGLALIESLAIQGATELVLLTRREPQAAELARLEPLKAAGLVIDIDSAADAADPTAFEAALARLEASDKPVAAIFHLAGVVRDEALTGLDDETLASVFAPKLLPVILLHHWEARLRPRQTVYFSSAASVFGPSGQGAHAAANAVLEALAQYRSQQGFDTVALAWGYWDITTTGNERELASQLRQRGMEAMPAAQALALLAAALAGDAPVYAPMRVDWPRLAAAAVSSTDLAPFTALTHVTGKTDNRAIDRVQRQTHSASPKPLLQQTGSGFQQDGALREKLRDLIAAVLHCPAERITGDANLVSLGLDSLLFLELSQRLQKELGVTINAETAFRANTLDAFAEALESSALCSLSPSTTPAADRKNDLYRRVRAMLADVLNCPAERIKDDDNLVSLGLDSLLFLELSQRLEKEIGVAINAGTAFRANTLKAFVAALQDSLPEQQPHPANDTVAQADQDIVAALQDADSHRRAALARAYLRQKIAAQLHCDENSLGDDSHLVQLGFDSLLFLELSETISRELGVRMNAETAFRAGTLGALADSIAEALATSGPLGRESAHHHKPAESDGSDLRTSVIEFPRRGSSSDDGLRNALSELQNGEGNWLAENGDVLPRDTIHVSLSGLQRSRWLSRGEVARHMYVEYDKPADFDVDAFEAAWNRVVARHPFMRVTIDADGSIRVLPQVEKYVIQRFDWRELTHGQQKHERASLRAAMSWQAQDLGRWPHFDLRVSRVDNDNLRIHLDIDTTLIDIESFQIILRELHLAMTQPERILPPLDFSPLDYQAALLALAETQTAGQQNDAVAGDITLLPPPPDMPLLNRMSSHRRKNFLIWREALPRAQWLALKARAEEEKLSGTAVLLAVYGLALRQWTTRSAFTLRLDYTDRQPLHAHVMNSVLDATASMPVGLNLLQAANFAALAKQCGEAVAHRLALPLADSDVCLRHYAATHGEPGKSADALPVAFTSLLGVRQTYAIPETSDPLLGMPTYEYTAQPHTALHLQALEEESALLFNIDAVETLFPDELGETLLLTLKRLLETLADLPEAWTAPLEELLPFDAQISDFTESALRQPRVGEIEETA